MSPQAAAGAAGAPTVVLTGATSGIGRAAAFLLAGRAGRLVLHGLEREEDVAGLLDGVRASLRPGARLFYFAADFGDLAQVARLAGDIRAVAESVDVLVNNAGRPGPPALTVTDAGVELAFQTNYLAPVALTEGLAGLVGGESPGRIVNVASATHLSATLRPDDVAFADRPYSPSAAYAASKLALVTWSCWLAANRPGPLVEVVSMHPGVVSTGLLHAMFAVAGDPPEHAAGNVAYVASRSGDNGAYYDERTPVPPSPQAADPEAQARLLDVTARLLREPG